MSVDTVTTVTYTEFVRQFSAQDIVRALRKRGAELVRQKGSHATYRVGNCQATVAMHKGDVPRGTVRAIERAFEPELGEGWLK
jgi:predicted RNA binding protein YcfA (HicA-like mRNA interferase family)